MEGKSARVSKRRFPSFEGERSLLFLYGCAVKRAGEGKAGIVSLKVLMAVLIAAPPLDFNGGSPF